MKKNIIIIISAIIIVVLICIIIYLTNNRTENNVNKLGNSEAMNQSELDKEETINFLDISLDNENLTEDEKTVIRYFDDTYFSVSTAEDLGEYPIIYSGAKVKMSGKVRAVIKNDTTGYEALISLGKPEEYSKHQNNPELIMIKSNKQDKNIIQGNDIDIYGKYTGINTYLINSKNLSFSTINVFYTVYYGNSKKDLKTINEVAKYIFGNNITMQEAPSGGYKVTLDKDINENLKSFSFNTELGQILPDTGGKSFYTDLSITPDLEHYIFTRCEFNTSLLVVEFYDKNFEKLWSREFNNVENNFTYCRDWNNKNMFIMINKELHLLDLSTGKDMITPILFDSDGKGILMAKNGALVIDLDNNNNMITKVDLKGNIEWKVSTKYKMGLPSFDMQIIDDNYVVTWEYLNEATYEYESAYIVLDDQGNKILEKY